MTVVSELSKNNFYEDIRSLLRTEDPKKIAPLQEKLGKLRNETKNKKLKSALRTLKSDLDDSLSK